MQIENNLKKMKVLAQQIKELQAEYDMLKADVINNWFVNNETYQTEKGLVLATYKLQERIVFNQSKFKTDHADYYLMYSDSKPCHTFLLK